MEETDGEGKRETGGTGENEDDDGARLLREKQKK